MPSLYGHFGQGCVHTRIPFDLYSAEGVAAYRAFLERAADLVVSYGGSLSGEHGDGQSRGELLGKMFGPELVAAFGELKAIFDPGNRMNPARSSIPPRWTSTCGWARTGPRPPRRTCSSAPPRRRVVRSGGQPLRGHREVPPARPPLRRGHVPVLPGHRRGRALHPGRARLLFEMLNGHPDSPVTDGWRSGAVRDALDLCLACKGCKTDCPAGVDMATYKAEFLAHHWQGRQWRRPRSDLSLGWLPLLARR